MKESLKHEALSRPLSPLRKIDPRGTHEKETFQFGDDIKRLVHEELKRQRDAPSASYEEISIEIKTPFTRGMESVDPLFHFLVLNLELYDGNANPREHILHYHYLMVPLGILKEKRKAMMCKMFGNSLKGLALTWCYGLKSGSIKSFRDLSKKFQGQFTLSIKAKKEPNYLSSAVQSGDENLRSYTLHSTRRSWRW